MSHGEGQERSRAHALAPFGPMPRSWGEMGWLAVLTESETKLGCALAMHADSDGRCMPGQRLLLRFTGLHKSTLFKAASALEDFGLIRRESVPHPRLPGLKITAYTLLNPEKPPHF